MAVANSVATFSVLFKGLKNVIKCYFRACFDAVCQKNTNFELPFWRIKKSWKHTIT